MNNMMDAMKLTPFPKRPYSMLETHVFNMLPKNGRRIKSRQLADARAKMGNWKVANPLNTITVTMNNLMVKVKANKEDFVIVKDGKRPGHHEVEYWIERK
jgi:hypothetical protein